MKKATDCNTMPYNEIYGKGKKQYIALQCHTLQHIAKEQNQILQYNAIFREMHCESCYYLKIYHQNHPKNLYIKEMYLKSNSIILRRRVSLETFLKTFYLKGGLPLDGGYS